MEHTPIFIPASPLIDGLDTLSLEIEKADRVNPVLPEHVFEFESKNVAFGGYLSQSNPSVLLRINGQNYSSYQVRPGTQTLMLYGKAGTQKQYTLAIKRSDYNFCSTTPTVYLSHPVYEITLERAQ